MHHRYLVAFATILIMAVHAPAEDFTDAELKAGAAARSQAIKEAAAKVKTLEDSRTGGGTRKDREELADQIKAAKREYNQTRSRTPEDFAADARMPEPAAVDAEQGKPQPDMPRTADDWVAEMEARRREKAEAMKGLIVRMPYSKVWVPREGVAIEFGICDCFFDGEPPTQGFFQVGEETHEIVIKSTDEKVVLPTRDEKHLQGPYFFVFGKPGKATVRVRVGDYTVAQEIEVVMAPVAPKDKTDFVIREIGLPTHKSDVYVKWPDVATHDCFFYQPQAGKPFIGEHWGYRDFQDLVLSIKDGEVHGLGTNRKRATNQIELRAEQPGE